MKGCAEMKSRAQEEQAQQKKEVGVVASETHGRRHTQLTVILSNELLKDSYNSNEHMAYTKNVYNHVG